MEESPVVRKRTAGDPSFNLNFMNQDINKIELCGIVGMVRINEVQGTKVANFSLMTEHKSVNKRGSAVCESTWHNVVVWESDNTSLDKIEKGVRVHVTGRMRNSRYTGVDGSERIFTEIVAASIKKIDIHTPGNN